jgi:hypothetical protein
MVVGFTTTCAIGAYLEKFISPDFPDGLVYGV